MRTTETSQLQSGFVIYDLAEFGRVTIHDLPVDMPLEVQEDCLACRQQLAVVCSLIAFSGAQSIRVGGCRVCGYIGYIDHPARVWLEDFYSQTWDTHIARDSEWVQQQPQLTAEPKGRSRLIAAKAGLEFCTDKTRPVLEVGVGYGNLARHLQQEGFATVVGVEHSPHRAHAVTRAFGIPVVIGSFESSGVQAALAEYSSFGLIISHHVFEHAYDGNEFLAAASRLQKLGDTLVLALPDVVGEHAGYVVYYPPHLHAYSKKALEFMLNRHGYEIVSDRSPSDDNMVIVAQKVDKPDPHMMIPTDALGMSIAKIRKGLGLSSVPRSGFAICEWPTPGAGYDNAQAQHIPSRVVWYGKKIWRALNARIGRHTPIHAMLVGPLERRFSDAPIEIQWSGPLRLLFK